MTIAHYTIRTGKQDDVEDMLSLAKEEGWNPGLYDALPFYSTDPNGFFVGELDGKKIACISAVAYNNAYGFVGLYIVEKKHRGHGWGLQLWNHAISYLGNRCMGLDGVIAQQDNYKKSGFQLYYRNIRFKGKGISKTMVTLTDLKQIPYEKVLEYDTNVCGYSRDAFLKQWLMMPNARGLGKWNGQRLEGYAVLRSCAEGHKIGPLFADNSQIAAELFEGLRTFAGSDEIFLDVPEPNREAFHLAESANMTKVFETAGMYTSAPPKQILEKVYGVTTFELG